MNINIRSSALRSRSIDVLIVDEDTDASARLQAALEENGCIARTIASEDGSIAGALLAETVADESPELGRIGVVAITSSDAPSPGPAFDAYLREPTSLEEITDLVRRLGGEMRAARAAAREAAR